MRSAIIAVAVAWGITVTTPLEAGEKVGGGYMSYTGSCGQIVGAHDKQLENPGLYTAYKYWLEGYVTATNYNLPDTVNILGNSDIISAMLWIVNHCKQNPLSQVNQAAEHLVRELYPKRHRTAKDAGR